MINLFNIPNYTIDTSKFTHYLHGDITKTFEDNFCSYVGAKYACTFSSATNAIFLAMLGKQEIINIPSMIPPVVANALITAGNKINFIDNTKWVGDSYVLHRFNDYKIIDSAQKVDKNQYQKEANDEDLMIFSFYPTKPVGGSDGGIIVSNDYNKIKWFKEATMNGMSYAHNNWDRTIKFPGYKMYMNSIQCYIANQNLNKLDAKKYRLKQIRELYNNNFNLSNSSDHLYRISINNRDSFIEKMKQKGITCGIHYNALHTHEVYKKHIVFSNKCYGSLNDSKTTVSIPFHEALTDKETQHIIKQVKPYLYGKH
tara:strand:+ start:271 stop:1209 length:939 start_codon:yes stop_codon:yes gene_type:complete